MILKEVVLSEKIFRIDALTSGWTIINFLAKCQGGRLFQYGHLLIFAKYNWLFNNGHIRSQNFWPLMIAVGEFHSKNLYSNHPFHLNLKFFLCQPLISDVFLMKTILDSIWHHFLSFPITPFICYFKNQIGWRNSPQGIKKLFWGQFRVDVYSMVGANLLFAKFSGWALIQG